MKLEHENPGKLYYTDRCELYTTSTPQMTDHRIA